MIVMIIFLALTVIFVIFTAIYLKNKDKQNNKNITFKDKEIEGTKRKKKSLEKLFNIKIKENIICVDNKYSSIIKLGNIDYNMLSDNEQEVIEQVLIQTALTIDSPIQFFTTTEFLDTSKAINIIKQNKVSNKSVQEYQYKLQKYLEKMMNNRSVSIVSNYAVISYIGEEKDVFGELNRKISNIKNSLLRANISSEILSENELYNLIYREFNKNGLQKIDNLLKGEKIYVSKKEKTRK